MGHIDMTDHFIQVNGIKLHYVEEGEGPLVILLHGWPDFWYGWKKQIPVLSKKYRVVAPDLRGFNLSDKPVHVDDQRLSNLTLDIVELIRALGNENAIVVGNDWGGAVAWALATNYPEMVSKIAVLNAIHPAELHKAFLALNFSQIKKSYYMFVFQVPWIPEWVLGKSLKRFFRNIFKRLTPNVTDTRTESCIEKYVEAYSRPGVLRATLNLYRAAFRHSEDLELRTSHLLTTPVLMIWGEKDVALNTNLTYTMKDRCVDFRAVYDPQGGHFIQLDNPELVNRTLLEFFER